MLVWIAMGGDRSLSSSMTGQLQNRATRLPPPLRGTVLALVGQMAHARAWWHKLLCHTGRHDHGHFIRPSCPGLSGP